MIDEMAQSVRIPPDAARVIEAFWKEQIRQAFGHTPPTPEEELAHIETFRERGLPVVPLADGSRVSVASAGRAPRMAEADDGGSDISGRERGGTPAWKWVVIGAMVLLAALPIVGPPLRTAARAALGSSGGPGADGHSDPSVSDVSLPADIDALVTSGDVRVPLVVPRTLEVRPSGALTSTTFVVVPVEVEEADWPCPSRKFKGRPAACWVFGSVVNYLIGVPHDGSQTDALFEALAAGGSVWLRMSTEQVFRFVVVPDGVRQTERHRTEILAQDHFGLTLVGLGGEGQSRPVAVASYVPEEVGGVSALARGAPPAVERTVSLGGVIRLSDGLHIVPVRHQSGGARSELWIAIEGDGRLPHVSTWRAWGMSGGERFPARIRTVQADRVVAAVDAPQVDGWLIDASGTICRVDPTG
jgi:hypothetical protein